MNYTLWTVVAVTVLVGFPVCVPEEIQAAGQQRGTSGDFRLGSFFLGTQRTEEQEWGAI